MTALLFPGQGSQFVGMAKDFNDNFKIASFIFEEIEDACSLNLREIIFQDSNNLLNQTNYTQVSIFASSLSIFKTLETEFDINIKYMLGHSLGEYTALACSNILSISDSAKLLKIRGNLMNSAIEPNKSGMVALIGINCTKIEKIIQDKNLNLEIANDNSPIQIVVSGLIEDINKSENDFLSNGVKKFIKLNVSAAFHSNFMKDAQEKLNYYIDNTNFNESNISIISNFNASINRNIDDIVHCLKNQMANRVRWTESTKTLDNTKEKKIIEIGPGKILSGLIKRISNTFDIISIDKIDDLKQLNNYEQN